MALRRIILQRRKVSLASWRNGGWYALTCESGLLWRSISTSWHEAHVTFAHLKIISIFSKRQAAATHGAFTSTAASARGGVASSASTALAAARTSPASAKHAATASIAWPENHIIGVFYAFGTAVIVTRGAIFCKWLAIEPAAMRHQASRARRRHRERRGMAA